MPRTWMVAATIAALASAGARAQQATPAQTPSVLELAAQGKAAEAWKAWDQMAPGVEKQRLGIQVAVATKQFDRGVSLYTELATATKTPDHVSLGRLAVGVARDMATDPDKDARVTACGAALLIDPRDAVCRKLLDSLARSQDVGDQALGVYTLANAGIRSNPGALTLLAASMPQYLRLQFARTLTHLTSAERVALVEPLTASRDLATQYQVAILLAGIPGQAAVGPLRVLATSNGPARGAATLGLAMHRDPGAVQSVGDMLNGLKGIERLIAGQALALALDKRGVEILDEMTRSPVDLDRIGAAEALARINPDQAYRVLVDSLNGGSAAVREQALYAAGVVRMGTDRAVYRRLVGESPMTRAFAVHAIAETLAPAPTVRSSSHP